MTSCARILTLALGMPMHSRLSAIILSVKSSRAASNRVLIISSSLSWSGQANSANLGLIILQLYNAGSRERIRKLTENKGILPLKLMSEVLADLVKEGSTPINLFAASVFGMGTIHPFGYGMES
jgi:hypothetical protein